MDMTTDQQVALEEALVPQASRLRIGKSNFCLKSDISSKESTLQLLYDVLRLTPFYKAFPVTTDVLEIYMQEFWATATVHHHSIRFKMDNKKHIFNLEYFREMLHICPKLPGHTFDELLFEEEILAFLRFLGHNGEIRKLTDVNINKLHQPWRSFVAIINKCLSGKSIGYDSLRLSLAQILWGLYHKRNVDFAYLLNSEAYKEYYAVATGATPPKTKASVRKTKSSSDTIVTPPSTAVAGTRLSTYAKGKEPAKASKAKNADEGTSIIPGVPDVPTEEYDEEISWKSSVEEDDDDDGDEGSADQDDDDAQDDVDQDDDDEDEGDDDDNQEESNDDDQDSEKEREEFIHPKLTIHDEEETKDEERFDPIPKTPKHTDDEGRVVQMADVHTTQEFKDSHMTLTLVNLDGQQQSSSVSSQFVTSMLNPTLDAGIDSIFETTSHMDVQAPTIVGPLPLSAPTLTPSTIATISTVPQAPTPPTTASSTLLQDLPNFGLLFGFDHRLKTLEANFSEFVQMNQFVRAVSSIPGIVQRYMDQRMNEAVKVAVQMQSDRLRDEAQAENEEFLKNLDENIQKIIKEQVKEQVKTSYAVAADLSEMELKKILIEKIKGNKDTVTLKRRRDDDADKDEEPSSGSDRGSKRRREGKEPESASAPKEKATRTIGKSTQGSISRQTSASKSAIAEEPMQTTNEMEEPSHPEVEIGADEQPIAEPSQHPKWFSQQKKPPTPDRDWNKTLPATHGSIQPWISELAKQTDSRSSFNELMDTPVDFLDFLMNRLKVDTLTPEMQAGPTYELMKGSCKSLVELEFFLEEVYKATTE
nr:hypothetical protein [Tanacetum cinerariifolium]